MYVVVILAKEDTSSQLLRFTVYLVYAHHICYILLTFHYPEYGCAAVLCVVTLNITRQYIVMPFYMCLNVWK